MITFRRAKVADADAMAEMQRRSIRALAAGTYAESTVRAWAEGVDPLKFQGAITAGETIEVACDGDRIIGFGRMVLGEDRIRGLYVDPDYARQGLGTRLLERLEQLAREQGVVRLHLSSSLNALAFYRHHGYVQGPTELHELRCNTPIECVAMSKPLAGPMP